jgi:protein-S-isoprenylcysteine O-methyltransferase Ste14
MKSYLLVAAQFILLIFIAIYCGVVGGIYSNLISLMAILLGIVAVAEMRFRVSIFPDVKENQIFITGGPYRLIRNPMYLAVLLIAASLVSHKIDFFSVLAWIMLLVVLRVKIKIEEAGLLKKFPSYVEYLKRTKRLVPWIY